MTNPRGAVPPGQITHLPKGTRSVPILSTPQSILFVDLRLPPGESRSYKFKFTLPKGIPPSHKGKAIKIAYNLVLGTQRPGKGVVQPTIIEVPFRVLPHVNGLWFLRHVSADSRAHDQ